MTLEADPRLLARYNNDAQLWSIAGGRHRIMLGADAATTKATADVLLTSGGFGK